MPETILPRKEFKLRDGQRRLLKFVEEHRVAAGLTRRQYGKTTYAGAFCLKRMMKVRDHTIIFGSAKLSLAREVVRKEAAIIRDGIMGLRENARLKLALAGDAKLPGVLDDDALANEYEAQRLEFRYYHSQTSYSRTKVVALLPDTVGETGDLICDEIGRVKNFREVWEAIEPIISSNPNFRCTFLTTPPPDDTHFSFEMLLPPPGTVFPVNPVGNIYRSEMGIPVLRIDAYDAYAGGVPVYDSETGAALTPAEHRRQAHDKDAWDRNYGCKFVVGGTSACDLLRLNVAQERGVGNCATFQIECDGDFDAAMDWLAKHQSPMADIGLGFDVATTTKETSNPSVVAVVEREGPEITVRAFLIWKTRDPDVAIERLRRVAMIVARRAGGRARGLAVDATNEKYFAESVRKDMRSLLPVTLVVASEAIEKPGLDKPTNWKQFLGSQYVGLLEDNHLTLPPESYVKLDHRLVKKDRGLFVCDPSPEGWHGDTFDGAKLGVHAVLGLSGPFAFSRVPVLRAQDGDRESATQRLTKREAVLI